MYFLFTFLLLPSMINALVTVPIHRSSLYQPFSSCAFLRNVTLPNDASIQSCTWECVHEYDCQTAVYFNDEKVCSMFAEFWKTGSIQSSGDVRASVICYRKNHEPIITCLSTATTNQEEKTTVFERMTDTPQTSINSLSTITTGSPVPLLLTGKNETVTGLWNTVAGDNGTLSTAGWGIGQYVANEMPIHAFDNDTGTKYTSFGNCNGSICSNSCGVNTGLYMTPQRGASLLTVLRFYTGNDCPDRDPLTITIEGSNKSAGALDSGSSWTLIYNGSTGLNSDPGRNVSGVTQNVSSNVWWYLSYRILVTSIRGDALAVQYSEIKLLGH